jgi:hypothetical protein
MKPLFAALYMAASAFVLLGQSPNAGAGAEPQAANSRDALEERIRSLPKRFPPEFYSVNPPPRYCVYHTLDTKSVSIKRCEPPSPAFRLRLVPPLKNGG